MLGRGTCFDGIEELTGGSSEAHRNFFHKFIKLFSKAYFNEHVYLPRNQDERERWTMDYNGMGLPGVLGSTDCVHVKWERCPVALANNCTGKEGYPTLAWQCSVNHKMRFISTSKVFYGASNDKTICKYDDFTRALHSKTMFGDTNFTLRTRTADGRDKLWEMDVHWSGVDGHHDEEDWSASSRRIINHRAMRKLLDYSSVGIRFVRTPDISEDDDENEF